MALHSHYAVTVFAAVATRPRADSSSMEGRRGNKRPYQPKHSPSYLTHNNHVGPELLLVSKNRLASNEATCKGYTCWPLYTCWAVAGRATVLPSTLLDNVSRDGKGGVFGQVGVLVRTAPALETMRGGQARDGTGHYNKPTRG